MQSRRKIVSSSKYFFLSTWCFRLLETISQIGQKYPVPNSLQLRLSQLGHSIPISSFLFDYRSG